MLITTRLRATGGVAVPVELKKMKPEEGALLLLRRANRQATASDTDRKVARQIATELDGLPLALDQAGAFIEEMQSTPGEYLELYRAGGEALRARRGELAADHPSVTVTFSLSFTRVSEANAGAADLVRACAFLAPDAIPEEIFTGVASQWGGPLAKAASKPLAWLLAIQDASRFGLIQRSAESRTLNIHRLVQEVVKDEMDSETRRMWAECAVKAMDKAFPPGGFRHWPQCERLIEHARVSARLAEKLQLSSGAAARLLNGSGLYLTERAQYAEAEPLFLGALTIHEKAAGPEHLDTSRSLNNLAALYRAQGRYGEAEPLYRHALAIRKRLLGPDHPDVAIILNNLGTFILKSCRNRAGNMELLGVAEGQLRDEEDLLEVEPRCDHLLAEGGEIVLVSAAVFLE